MSLGFAVFLSVLAALFVWNVIQPFWADLRYDHIKPFFRSLRKTD